MNSKDLTKNYEPENSKSHAPLGSEQNLKTNPRKDRRETFIGNKNAHADHMFRTYSELQYNHNYYTIEPQTRLAAGVE